jgi:ABC-type molybdate transport system substrate-binding protein
MNMKQALATYISTSEVDVIIAPESQFYGYAYRGYFSKLSDELPTDIYSSLTDQFYITDMEEDTEKDAYGIYLTDTKLYKNNTVNTEPYVLGILVNSEHREASVDFIRYLFNEDK